MVGNPHHMSDASRESGHRPRILVVDDEIPIARAFARMLGPDYEVTVEHDAEQAVARICGGARYDLILSDLSMPSMGGIQFHAEVHTIDPAQAVRLVFITAAILTPDLERVLTATGTAVFSKPLAMAELRALVHARTGSRAAR